MQNIESSKKVFELDVEKIRKDFPILQREVNNKKLVYFDRKTVHNCTQVYTIVHTCTQLCTTVT